MPNRPAALPLAANNFFLFEGIRVEQSHSWTPLTVMAVGLLCVCSPAWAAGLETPLAMVMAWHSVAVFVAVAYLVLRDVSLKAKVFSLVGFAIVVAPLYLPLLLAPAEGFDATAELEFGILGFGLIALGVVLTALMTGGLWRHRSRSSRRRWMTSSRVR